MEYTLCLTHLYLQNFATFTSQEIHFHPDFNAIVGETGSGKSLLMDALCLILGSRADKRIIRSGADQAILEARFQCKDKSIKAELDQMGYPMDDEEIIIKRVIQLSGASKSYLNHLSCSTNVISQISKKYIDLVGQFENQKLLSEEYQLQIIDHFSKNHELLKGYQDLYQEYRKTLSQKNELLQFQQNRSQQIDFLSFQLQEINALNPSSQDEAYLLSLKEKFLTIEKRKLLNQQFEKLLLGDDQIDGLSQIVSQLNSLSHKNQPLLEDFLIPMRAISDSMNEMIIQKDRLLAIEDEELSFDEIINRLDQYQKIRKKFGGDIDSVIRFKNEAEVKLRELEKIESHLETIDSELESLSSKLYDVANQLHAKRKKSIEKLNKTLTENVQKLKMTGAIIDFHIEKSDSLTPTGNTLIEFNAQTNPGGGFHPVKSIASGGELSRILLSLRQTMSSKDSISVFLFDEIDTGIGGETAIAVGRALQDVALKGQVIAITHLPQIAQFASKLISVKKEIKKDKTFSKAEGLFGADIKKEIHSMLQLN